VAEPAELPLVVKVGGSLVETGRMAAALAMLCAASRPVVIVPGGGHFADSVRALQPLLKLDDALAHKLAMLAMHQMAELMASTESRLEVVESLDEIRDSLERGRIPVWAPMRMIAGDEAIPAAWSATSDSLAARLAELLGGADLVLLKSVEAESGADAEALAEQGIVDQSFPAIVARAGLSWSIFGPRDDGSLRAVLEGQGGAGCRASSKRS
jgi:aspartokinase-like uncharacterized kinase